MNVRNILAGAISAVAVTAGAAFVYLSKTRTGFETFLKEMNSTRYPDVPIIFPDELDAAMHSSHPPVLFDARTPQEHAISCIRNAQYLNVSQLEIEDVEDLDRDRSIVIACSVGYRGAEAVRKLRSFGFTNVRNLYGGIFLWYNQMRPVFNAGVEVQRIHPVNSFWGQFITRGGKVRVDESPELAMQYSV